MRTSGPKLCPPSVEGSQEERQLEAVGIVATIVEHHVQPADIVHDHPGQDLVGLVALYVAVDAYGRTPRVALIRRPAQEDIRVTETPVGVGNVDPTRERSTAVSTTKCGSTGLRRPPSRKPVVSTPASSTTRSLASHVAPPSSDRSNQNVHCRVLASNVFQITYT